MNTSIDPQSILAQWDYPNNLFPAIPPYDSGYARARLTAFVSDKQWLTVFEIINFNAMAVLCVNDITAIGNRSILDKFRHRASKSKYKTVVTPDRHTTDDHPYFPETSDGSISINPLDFEVEIYGAPHHFAPSSRKYQELGIDLHAKSAGELDAIVKVLRFLSYDRPDLVFLNNQELQPRRFGHNPLPKFMQLYDWQHPDYRQQEKPSNSPCLRSLATAMAHNDPSMYHCPKEAINTHWSFWPEWSVWDP